MWQQNTIRALFALACALAALPALAQDGSYDTSWGDGGRTRFSIGTIGMFPTGMAAQADGKAVLVGISVDSPLQSWAARLLPNGEMDTGFGPGGSGVFLLTAFDGFPNSRINSVSMQADGRIVLAGIRSSSSAGSVAALARLTPAGQAERGADGAPVRLFQLSANTLSPTSGWYDAVVLPNGKIIAVGFTNGTANADNLDFAVARLSSDLMLDTSFNAAGERPGVQRVGFDQGSSNMDVAFSVAVQADGKIVATGRVVTLDGSYGAGVLRLNADGSVDSSFGSNGRVYFRLGEGMSSTPQTVAVDRQQRIVLGGGAIFADTGAKNFYFVRLRAGDGSFDTSLNGQGWVRYDSADASGAQKILVQADGKIVLGGDSSAAGGAFRVLRVLGDGTLDPGFGVAGQVDGQYAADDGSTGQAFALDRGNRLLVAGQSSLDGRSVIGVARLTSDRIFADGFQ